ERTPGAGARSISAHPAVIERIAARADWQAELARRIGAPIALRPDARLAISGGHVDAENP
ncbi:MAG: ribonuclease, partial [Alphaproteobacteria bacterium]